MLPQEVLLQRAKTPRTLVNKKVIILTKDKKIIKNILREDILEEAKNIKIPVIFIYGDKDIHTPARFGRTLSNAVDNSELIIIQDADHWLHKADFLEISETIRGLK